jgi:hypothetical protein
MEASTNLTIATDNLAPGVYYLTITADASPQNVLGSVILKLTVTGGAPSLLLPALFATAIFVAALAFVSWRHLKPKHSMSKR